VSAPPGRASESLWVEAADVGLRLDTFLVTRLSARSRTGWAHIIGEGRVHLNGRAARASERVSPGSRIEIWLPAPPDQATAPGDGAPLSVLFEDSDVVALDKPAGQVTHPAPGNPTGTLVDALRARYPDIVVGDARRPGLVHRLDRDTSGVLLIARNDAALRALQRQWSDRSVVKEYLALVVGHPQPERATIDAPIGRDPRDRRRMAVVDSVRPARTRYETQERFARATLLLCVPETGRTHQIRVHLASIGYPIVADATYGTRNVDLGRHFLHAWRLTFRHPLNGARQTIEAPLPPDLAAYVELLRRA